MTDTDDAQEKYNAWLQTGIDAGYCSPVFCDTHEGPPWTDAELAEIDGGTDLCSWNIRLYGPNPPA